MLRSCIHLSLILYFAFLSILPSVVSAEEMTITTYYPSPNGAYDALNVKRLSVGDTNGDGSINASDVSASSGYLLVADKVGVGTISPRGAIDVGNTGTIYTKEIHFVSDTGYGGDNSDPYTLRKVHDSDDSSHLDLNLNDNGTEEFRIYGNSCNGYSCATYSGNLYHKFDALGNAYHAGGLLVGTTTQNGVLTVGRTDSTVYTTSINGNWITMDDGPSFNPSYIGSIWSQLYLYPDSGNTILGVDYNGTQRGNVGIGTTGPSVKLAVGGSGTNVYSTDAWIENNMHVQGNEGLTQGGRGRMRVGTAWGYMGLFADASSTGAANDLVLGATSNQVRVGSDGSGQNLKVAYRIGTSGLSPNDVPSGWGGGVTAWDICSRASIRYTSGISGGGWDLAEEYDSKDPTLKAGEVVSIDPKNDLFVVRTAKAADAAMLGVVSTKPSVLMGVEWNDPHYGNLPIAIIGRVPACVMFIEGERIEHGEMLTSSFLPGYAMKISGPGMVVGKALQAVDSVSVAQAPIVKSLSSIKWPEDDGSNKAKPFFRIPASSLNQKEKEFLFLIHPGYNGKYVYIGKIMVFVNVNFYNNDETLNARLYNNGLLLNAIKEQQTQIEELRKEIGVLRKGRPFKWIPGRNKD